MSFGVNVCLKRSRNELRDKGFAEGVFVESEIEDPLEEEIRHFDRKNRPLRKSMCFVGSNFLRYITSYLVRLVPFLAFVEIDPTILVESTFHLENPF